MNIFLKSAILLIISVTVNSVFAWEPPAEVSLKEKVRMSSVIIVGKADAVLIINTTTGHSVADHYPLKDNERLCMIIRVERVLFSAYGEPFYSPKTKGGTTSSIIFGDRHVDVNYFRKALTQQSCIFYLTRHWDRTSSVHFYPFFDYTNLFDPVSKEGEVTRLITAFEAVK